MTPSLMSGVLEARPISASRQKKVIWGPSWISSWALLTNTAIDHQWLEEGEEPSISKFAPRDHPLRPETPPPPGIEGKKEPALELPASHNQEPSTQPEPKQQSQENLLTAEAPNSTEVGETTNEIIDCNTDRIPQLDGQAETFQI